MNWCYTEISRLFQQFHDHDVLKRLSCDLPSPTASELQGEFLQNFLKLLAHTASERSWYLLHFTYTFPEQWVAIIAPGEGSNAGMNLFRRLSKLIIKAEEIMQDPDHGERVAAWLPYY